MSATKAWGEMLRAWAIPEEILDQAPEPPYGFPPELFRRRAETAIAEAPSASAIRAIEVLPDGGTVIDVGVGAGAASLPLASRASLITGIDPSEAMLEEFRETARTVGVEAHAVLGIWPEIGAEVPPADVVVCNHVLYNAPDLGPFAAALSDHARRRVVVEITREHPVAWMNDLWLRFHGIERPSEPTADTAVAALQELGVGVHREDRTRETNPSGFELRGDAIALTRRRLCLSPDRDLEIAVALGDRLAERDGLWSTGPTDQMLVTLWWDRS